MLWLLLVLQLPTRPVAARMRIWRRLQGLGAIAVKNAVYALPNRTETREDFEWVSSEVIAAGGQATVFEASTIDQVSNDELREAFRRARQAEYEEIVRSVEKAVRTARRQRSHDPRAIAGLRRSWRDRLSEIENADYFSAAGRDDARAAVARLDALAATPRASAAIRPAGLALEAKAFRGRQWLTRPRPGIDRVASAWLIRRFIDPKARFQFAESKPPSSRDVVAFDMFGGDFTHQGDRCTFEVLCARFQVTDAGVREIAEIVHDLDLKDGRFGRSDAAQVGALVEGLRQVHSQDDELLEHGIALFEALYRAHSTPPSTRRARSKNVPRRRKTSSTTLRSARPR
jgi:hypothetical protein